MTPTPEHQPLDPKILQAVYAYMEAYYVAHNTIHDVRAALKKGMAHSRPALELAVFKHDKRLKALRLDAPPSIKTNTRLFDLVRYMRAELHEANLITDAEYTWLCSEAPENQGDTGSPSRQRLEDYDELHEKLNKLTAP